MVYILLLTLSSRFVNNYRLFLEHRVGQAGVDFLEEEDLREKRCDIVNLATFSLFRSKIVA